MLAFDEMTTGRIFVGPPRQLTRVDFVRYAGVSGDYNPLHVDEVSAQATGQPSVFGHGMYSAGLLASAVADLVGLAHLRRYTVRFTRLARPDEEVFTELTIGDVRESEGTVTVAVDCALKSGDSEIVKGSAVAEYSR